MNLSIHKYYRSVIKLPTFFLTIMIFLNLAYDAFCFEHPIYDIQGKIDVEKKKIIATQKVTFTNNSPDPINETYFHIYPNRKFTQREKDFMMLYAGYFKVNPFPEGFQSGRMEIHSIFSGKEDLIFDMEGEDESLLKVSLRKELKPKEDITITIDFLVDIPHAYGRFGWHKNIMALSRFYPMLSVLDEGGWNKNPFYPFHRPFFSDAAHYSVKLTVPKHYIVIHSGEFRDEKIQDKLKILTIETPLPIREFSLSLSPDYKLYKENFNDITIKSFYLTGDESRAKQAIEDVRGLMDYYSKQFTPYPYKEFSIAPVYLGYGGEQMSNIAFIDTRVYKLPKMLNRYFDFLITHETGHQWFYNIIGVNEFIHMWLEEGINSYFILEYLENKYGKDAYVVEWPEAMDWLVPNFSFRRTRDYRYKIIARTKLNYSLASKLSSYKEPSSIFSITYGKGSAVTSMLRYVIKEDAFNRVFKKVFKEFRFRNFTVSDLVRICEEESNQDLDWFFSQWLHTTDNCDYAVKVKGNEIILENRGRIEMPVEVQVEFKDGGKKIIISNGRKKIEKIAVEKNKFIKRVSVDPKGELLDIDRTNNFWPRKTKLQPVYLYTPVYDIPLALPEDSYNLVFGPEIANGLGVKASLQKPYDQNFYIATDYEFGEQLQKSRVGYQLKNVFNSRMTAGFELFNTADYDGGEEDLAGGKIYVRKEIRPIAYGLTDINDHITFYLIRNRSLNKGLSLSGIEDSRNTSYLKKDESIVGTALHFGRSAPYFDPSRGFKINTLLESSGHFLGATQYFYRGSMDISLYHPVTLKSKLAIRLKYGWGYPDDKNLYEAGGPYGLRGYDRKTLRGSNMALGSIEYRFPILHDIKLSLLDNIFKLDSIDGVAFADLGQSWFNDIDDTDFKKDAGLGLRFYVDIGSFLEKVLIRADFAQAISDSDEDPRFWISINHAY